MLYLVFPGPIIDLAKFGWYALFLPSLRVDKIELFGVIIGVNPLLLASIDTVGTAIDS